MTEDSARDGVPAGEVYDWYVRGTTLLESGNPEAAAELLAHARSREPESASVLEALARALFDARRYAEAADRFTELVELSPDSDYARFGLGLSRLRLGDLGGAIEQLALAAAMRPGAGRLPAGAARGPGHRAGPRGGGRAVQRRRRRRAARLDAGGERSGRPSERPAGRRERHPARDTPRRRAARPRRRALRRAGRRARRTGGGAGRRRGRDAAGVRHQQRRAHAGDGGRAPARARRARRAGGRRDLGAGRRDAARRAGAGGLAGAGRRRRGAGRRRPGARPGAGARGRRRRRRGGPGLRAGRRLAAAGRGHVRRQRRPAVGRHQHGRHRADARAGTRRATGCWSASSRGPPAGSRTRSPASRRRRCTRSRCAGPGAKTPLVVGDRLDTDIEGANRVGVPSLLVLTGVCRPADLLRAGPALRPTYLARDLRDGLLAAHPAVAPAGDGWACGGWTVSVRGAEVSVEGSGDPVDGLRALCVAWWAAGGDARRAATRRRRWPRSAGDGWPSEHRAELEQVADARLHLDLAGQPGLTEAEVTVGHGDQVVAVRRSAGSAPWATRRW